jgi:CRISPR-associated protein Csb2
MKKCLVISIRFLGDRYHGRTENGREPEWPPSPLRVFQALVAGVAPRWADVGLREREVPGLEWLQGLGAPRIIAPISHPGRPVLNYVRENLTDVAPDKRDAKFARPTIFRADPLVRYSWWFESCEQPLAEAVAHCARHCHSLGWGVDMIVGNGEITESEPVADTGEVWYPEPDPTDGGSILRVPRCSTSEASPGTLAELRDRYLHSLNRIRAARNPVPPLSAFAVVGYRRATDPASRPWTAFAILKPDASGNVAFDTARRCRDIAAWIRHVTGQVCVGWPFGEVAAFVQGHDESGSPLKGDGADARFMYLPLPTINSKLNRVESIRRVLIAAPPEFQDRVDWIRRRLPGQELIWNEKIVGLLNILPTSDWVLRQYVGESRVWSTVSPVIWPGHDDRDARKAEGILRKAFVHAGMSPELVATIEDMDWRPVGFRAGLELAHRYRTPDKIQGRQYHVRVRFPHAIRGPLAIGAGRYRGLGVFAAEGTA